MTEDRPKKSIVERIQSTEYGVLKETSVFLVLLFVIAISAEYIVSEGQLIYRGVTTSGVVVDIDDSMSYEDDPDCRFWYRFTVNGKILEAEGHDNICPGEPGDPIEVLFDPVYPTNSALADSPYFERTFALKVLAFLAGVIALIVSATLWTAQAWRSAQLIGADSGARGPRALLICLLLLVLPSSLGYEGPIRLPIPVSYSLIILMICVIGLWLENKLFLRFQRKKI